MTEIDISVFDNDILLEKTYKQLPPDEIMEVIDEFEKNPQAFIEVCLKIQDKAGQLVPFILNKAQQMLYDEVLRQKELGQPIRIIVLKARQLGFSTLVAGLFYHRTGTFYRNINTAIIAHKADASTNIFNKMKLFYDMLDPFLQMMRKNSNAKELIFENPTTSPQEKRMRPGLRSKIMIETAVDKNALRSATVHNLHMSEIAFWPYPRETYTSAMQAVPTHPKTCVIIESTANGVGNFFYDLWQRAKRGESEFTPLFFPWFLEDEYKMPVPDDFQLTEEEKELKEEFDLSDEQIVWRRWCIQANCGGDIEMFKQEYPCTDTEAFIASGRPVFDTNLLEKALKECKKPIKEGNLVEENGRIVFRTAYKGYLKIWEEPKDEDYIIGIDTSQGLEKGDYSCMAVWSRKRKKVAEWHGHMAPDLLGKEAVKLAKYYKLAWIIPEINNMGISTLDTIRHEQYYRLYRRRTSPDKSGNEPTDMYGFWTSSKSKPLLIKSLSKLIRDDATLIVDEETIRECISYVYDASGRMNAQQGCYDDRVIANALAVFFIDQRPDMDKPIKVPREKVYGRVSNVTGY